jgi:hypothetical protein
MRGFVLSPFLNEVFREVPLIVSPADDAIVSTPFTVTWQYASGAERQGHTATWEGGGAGISVEFGENGDQTATFNVPLDGGTSKVMLIRAGSARTFDSFFGNIAVDDSVHSSFLNFSEPLRVTVVPESSTLSMLIAATLLVLGPLAIKRWFVVIRTYR